MVEIQQGVKSVSASFFAAVMLFDTIKGQRSRREQEKMSESVRGRLHDCSSPWSYSTVTNPGCVGYQFSKEQRKFK